MTEQAFRSSTSEGDFVPFLAAGESAKGEYRCAECGYGVASFRTLPRCPMCGGGSWEQAAWSPFRRNAGETR
jgi:rubrerythrin